MLQDNYNNIEKRIQKACSRANRQRSEVTLIAVSKTKPVELINQAFQIGMRHFGENKVQELAQKYDDLSEINEEIQWHQIGHLQRNKVKYIVDKVSLIHSVDSLRLAEQINNEAKKKNVVCDILLEVNISEEESKFGLKEDEVLPLLHEFVKLSHIRVRGLMTVAPYDPNPENNRKYFKKMRELYVDIKTKNIDNIIKGNSSQETPFCQEEFNILSMGMTGDFEIAIEEGATMVRVGTGIFGERNYTKE